MQTTRKASGRSVILLLVALVAQPGFADDTLSNVEVSFGRGLNTAQPGNSVNHAVLPSQIKVKAGGVVDFGIAGFHDIIIFKPGFTLDDLRDAGGGDFPTDAIFPFVLPSDPMAPLPPELALLTDSIYYRGLNPAGGPPQTPPTTVVSNAMNRSEPVAFLTPGTYLVICNVRPHLVDGMYAYVKVLPP
jgi:plastocyanin